jgi:hypothetical protein
MHLVATNIQLAVMIGDMCFVAAEFFGRMRLLNRLTRCPSGHADGSVHGRVWPEPGAGHRRAHRHRRFLMWIAILVVGLWRHPAQEPPS